MTNIGQSNMSSAVNIQPRGIVQELDIQDSISDSEENFVFDRKKEIKPKLEPIPINLTDKLPQNQPVPLPEPPQSIQPLQPPHAISKPFEQSQAPSPQQREFSSPSKLKRGFSDSSEGSPSPTKTFFRKRIKKGYELASYEKAQEYLHTRSYRHKIVGAEGEDDEYQPIPACGQTSDFKQFGLGVYLYFEFIKRLSIALFLCGVASIFPLIVAWPGSGLEDYTESSSFTITLARFSLGNIKDGGSKEYLYVTVADLVTMIIMIFFYIHWRGFRALTIDEVEKDLTIVNPSRYAVSVEQFCDNTSNIKTLEAELRGYIDNLYKGAYEVEIVYDYQGNFDRFVEYDEQIEVVEKEHQIIKQTQKDPTKLVQEEGKLNQIEEELKKNAQAFQPLYAIIHFRTLKAKFQFINHCRHFKLQKGAGPAFQRCIMCTPDPPVNKLFLGKFPIMIRNNDLTRPEQINWRNTDISNCSSFVRWMLSLLFLAISIIITSGLIGFLMLYVASTSNCQNVTLPSTSLSVADQIAAVKLMDQNAHYCYCNDNLASIYTDPLINEYCDEMSTKVLIANALQIGASVLSAITNVILGIIVTLLANKLLRPSTVAKQYQFIFWGVLLSNWINAAIIPLFLNGSVFGLEFVSYLRWADFINVDNVSIFDDFTSDWYAIVSPYYTTMVIIASFISPFIHFIVFSLKSCIKHWRVSKKCLNEDAQSPYIQKEANSDLSSIQFEFAIEHSQIALYLFITYLYSGLIPLLLPIYAVGLMWIFNWKRATLVRYCIKVPADQSLSQSLSTFFPLVILAHGCFSVWSHTTPGVFMEDAPLIRFDWTFFEGDLNRVFNDILILGEPALVILVLLIDITIVKFISFLIDCCGKDDLEMPPIYAAIENKQYSDRLQKANILGSYKVANSPQYGHALKAFNQLLHRSNLNNDDPSQDELQAQNFT